MGNGCLTFDYFLLYIGRVFYSKKIDTKLETLQKDVNRGVT